MGRLPTNRPPTHPGEMLRYEFLEPLGITQRRLAAFVNYGELLSGRWTG